MYISFLHYKLLTVINGSTVKSRNQLPILCIISIFILIPKNCSLGTLTKIDTVNGILMDYILLRRNFTWTPPNSVCHLLFSEFFSVLKKEMME